MHFPDTEIIRNTGSKYRYNAISIIGIHMIAKMSSVYPT